jgi:hypothetical protein
MSDAGGEPPFHLFLEPQEVQPATSALRLLISDEAHEAGIRRLAREVLAQLDGAPDERGLLTLTLTPQQMKITFSAVRLMVNDLGRAEAAERDVLRGTLEKLPDEHTMRAIEIA